MSALLGFVMKSQRPVIIVIDFKCSTHFDKQ